MLTHMFQTADAPYLFRNKKFLNAFLGIFYKRSNTCLAAKYPAAFTKGPTIESIMTFGAFVCIRMLCLLLAHLMSIPVGCP